LRIICLKRGWNLLRVIPLSLRYPKLSRKRGEFSPSFFFLTFLLGLFFL
jgi:hypothetical protein